MNTSYESANKNRKREEREQILFTNTQKKNHFFFLEKTGILIRTHEYESSIRILKNNIYIT